MLTSISGYFDFSVEEGLDEDPAPLEPLLPLIDPLLPPLAPLLPPEEPLLPPLAPLLPPLLPPVEPPVEPPLLPPAEPLLLPELPPPLPTDDDAPSLTPSAAIVSWSSSPDASRPSFFWNSFSAACVLGPMTPSACTSWPFWLSFCCTCFTVSESWLLAWDWEPDDDAPAEELGEDEVSAEELGAEEAPAEELGDDDDEAPADELGDDWLVVGLDDCVSLLCDLLSCPAPAATALPANIAATNT